MSRRNSWVWLVCSGVLLFAVGSAFVACDTLRFQRFIRSELIESCRRRAITFEDFAERWIVRDQLDSLEASAKLLLMGTGLYVDIVVQEHVLYTDYDEDLSSELLPVECLSDGGPQDETFVGLVTGGGNFAPVRGELGGNHQGGICPDTLQFLTDRPE